MYKLKFTRLQNEIFRLLCIKAGMPLNQREIAGLLKVSPTAVSKAIKKMEHDKYIKVGRSGNLKLKTIEIDRNNPFIIGMKRAENLKMIYESGIIDFLEDNFPGCTVILFGSYSLGEDTLSSDIDIAVIGSKKKEINTEKFDKILERKVFIHFYESFSGMKSNLKSNILNGIVLAGAIEL